MQLYQIRNTISGKLYYGISKNYKNRWYSHKHCYKKGTKTKLYDAMRSYGIAAFVLELLEEGEDSYIAAREVALIASDPDCYNLHQGGHIGFNVNLKSAEEVEQWKGKLREARAGRTPALGMKHSEETKKLCGEYGKLRWDIHGRYPVEEILSLRCVHAMRKYGISKTHYYRLKRAATNDHG